MQLQSSNLMQSHAISTFLLRGSKDFSKGDVQKWCCHVGMLCDPWKLIRIYLDDVGICWNMLDNCKCQVLHLQLHVTTPHLRPLDGQCSLSTAPWWPPCLCHNEVLGTHGFMVNKWTNLIYSHMVFKLQTQFLRVSLQSHAMPLPFHCPCAVFLASWRLCNFSSDWGRIGSRWSTHHSSSATLERRSHQSQVSGRPGRLDCAACAVAKLITVDYEKVNRTFKYKSIDKISNRIERSDFAQIDSLRCKSSEEASLISVEEEDKAQDSSRACWIDMDLVYLATLLDYCVYFPLPCVGHR